MIYPLDINISNDLIQSALAEMPTVDFRLTLNQPTGTFFYDPWTIKDEFKNSPWEQLLDSLPFNLGEARIVILSPKQTYSSHSDIDNRWHLALTNQNSFLIDLSAKKMHDCEIGTWYSMDAGVQHTAANFGLTDRVHLLVRQLLTNSELKHPVKYKIEANKSKLVPHRYIFDEVYSPLLNRLNVNNKLANFTKNNDSFCFETEKDIQIPNNENFIITCK